MNLVILLVIVFVIAIMVLMLKDGSSDNSIDIEHETPINNQAHSSTFNQDYIGDKCISLYARKGYSGFPIAGAYYQNLPISMVGKFNGYATTEPYNNHDKFAIAVYTDAGIQLGYIPKNNKKLYAYILKNGDKVHAYGYIGCDSGNSMYGEVCVETDKTLVTKRNKPYDIN